MQYFDTDGDGNINFDEFLVGIRVSLTSYCPMEAADLKGVYNCSFHPKVISGEMTEDQVFLEFLANFGDRNKDGRISRQEWNDYYSAVSASIDNDDHFFQLMKTAWKLD